MTGPLNGVRIIDLTTVAMGPYATQILGDMGADVIKIESPDGDVFRHVAPSRHVGMGAAFLNLNRNKRSIALDLKSEEDLRVLTDLLITADVLVYNIRPRSMRRLRLDYETLKELNPRLIHCGTYGFSEEGPYAGRPAFDDIIQAMSGLAALQGHNAESGPEYINSIIADKTAGLAAAYAISMALYERERSGQGQAIEVPMYETVVSFSMIEHLSGESFVPSIGGMGYERILSPNRKPYRTRDGYLSLLPYTSAQWQRFFIAAGRPEMASDKRVLDGELRSKHISELYGMLSSLVSQRTTQEWLELLASADIPMARVNSIESLLTDPHLTAVGAFRFDKHPTEGQIRGLGLPVRFSRTPGSVRRLAPTLNQHRLEVLAELQTDHAPDRQPGTCDGRRDDID